MRPDPKAPMDDQKYELLVILICPIIAGRGLRATRALPRPTPNRKLHHQDGEALAPDEVFAHGAGPPSCTPAPQPSGWSPTRTTPTTNTRRKSTATQRVKGNTGSWKSSQSQHNRMCSA